MESDGHYFLGAGITHCKHNDINVICKKIHQYASTVGYHVKHPHCETSLDIALLGYCSIKTQKS